VTRTANYIAPAGAHASQQPLLTVAGVSRSYDDGRVVALTDISLTIHENDYVAIMGPSGSGKSTLLNLLGTLDQPTTGDISFRGESLSKRRDNDRFRAATLGFVFQSFYLLPTLTAVENVQIPMFESARGPRERAQKAAELLTLVGLPQRASHLPARLSVGERPARGHRESTRERSATAPRRRANRQLGLCLRQRNSRSVRPLAS
jgi:ABC-type lipoprotein export system ATPase subunit